MVIVPSLSRSIGILGMCVLTQRRLIPAVFPIDLSVSPSISASDDGPVAAAGARAASPNLLHRCVEPAGIADSWCPADTPEVRMGTAMIVTIGGVLTANHEWAAKRTAQLVRSLVAFASCALLDRCVILPS